MTAPPRTKHKISAKKSIRISAPFPESIKKLLEIAMEMKKTGLADSFILNSLLTAVRFEGVADLMNLWLDEKDNKERAEIIADLQDLIDDCGQKGKKEGRYIKCNDLTTIAKDIRGFKDSLYQEVMKRGGITKLSELTDIPQPSLSRFFNSNAMPRRATVLKIAKALNLEEIKIDDLWSK